MTTTSVTYCFARPNLVNMVATRLAQADRWLNRLEQVDVDDGLLAVAADALHGAIA